MADADMQLSHRLSVASQEGEELFTLSRDADSVVRLHLSLEVRDLLLKRVRIREANPELEAFAPHANQRVNVSGSEVFYGQ